MTHLRAVCDIQQHRTRERLYATGFSAALSDHIGYLRREQEAQEMQQAFLAAQDGQQGPNLPNLDFSLKPGETVSLKPADKAPVPRSFFMNKRLAAMSILETSQSGALLPPPSTAAKLEPRSLSGPLHEGSSSAEGAALHSDKQHADHAAEHQGGYQKSAAAKGSYAARNVQEEQEQQHALPSSVTREGLLDEKDDEEDEQFGSFVVA